jgi:methylated-DNA-[protein]-cysteine S-methyltransferase
MVGKDASNLLSRVQKQNYDAMLKEELHPLMPAVTGLNHYFSGGSAILDHPLELQGTRFQQKVWSALREIPLGRVATYGEIAARIGRPGGARAVGQACGSNPAVLFVPCHRVVAADGKLGGFGSGLGLKKTLLLHEGVRMELGV